MKVFAIVAVVALLLLAGCAGPKGATYTSTGTDSSTSGTTTSEGPTGSLHLMATASEGTSSYTSVVVRLDGVILHGPSGTASFAPSSRVLDLVQLRDSSAILLSEAVPAGAYTGIELEVESAKATLADGSTVDLTVVGNRLNLAVPFVVSAGSEARFTFAISVSTAGATPSLQADAQASRLGGGATSSSSSSTTSASTTRQAPTVTTTTRASTTTTRSMTTTLTTTARTTSTTTAAPTQARLQVWFTSAAGGNETDFASLNLTLGSATTHRVTGNQSYAPLPGKVDVVRLANGTYRLALNVTLPPGNLTGLSFAMTAAGTLKANGNVSAAPANVTVPGGRLSIGAISLKAGLTTHTAIAVQVTKSTGGYTLSAAAGTGVIVKPTRTIP